MRHGSEKELMRTQTYNAIFKGYKEEVGKDLGSPITEGKTKIELERDKQYETNWIW